MACSACLETNAKHSLLPPPFYIGSPLLLRILAPLTTIAMVYPSEMVMGTPSYMAPEQCRGATRSILARISMHWAASFLLCCAADRPSSVPAQARTTGNREEPDLVHS